MTMLTNVMLIEPFYIGSHKQLIDLLYEELQTISLNNVDKIENEKRLNVHLATMTGKKWHWRARTSALYFAQTLPTIGNDEGDQARNVLFTSSTLPIHELIALRSDLRSALKIVYFHENQLVYPVRKHQDRDFQYGYNQILSCMVADRILFNSQFNMNSFLSNIHSFFKLQPDYRPKGLEEQIKPKCLVAYFPLQFENIDQMSVNIPKPIDLGSDNVFKMVWPHRWEFDKNPQLFFRAIRQLIEENVTNFQLYILGEGFTDNPEVFSMVGNSCVKPYLAHIGYLSSKEEYFKTLQSCDIVISTAEHEFFGVAMIEAVYCGCFPICPKKLAYPEIFGFTSVQNENSSNDIDFFYNSESELREKLKSILSSPKEILKEKQKQLAAKIDMENRFSWRSLKPFYVDLLQGNLDLTKSD